jgi:hypothetical protein
MELSGYIYINIIFRRKYYKFNLAHQDRKKGEDKRTYMNQQENQQSTTTNTKKDNDLVDVAEIQRKISLATEGFTTSKYCELVLKDRNRLSKENAITVCNYIIAMKRELNPRLNTVKAAI